MDDVILDLPLIGRIVLTLEDLIVIFATLFAVLVVTAAWSAFLPKKDTTERAKELIDRRQRLRDEALQMANDRRRRKNVRAIGAMRTIVDRFKLFSAMQAEQRAMLLARAGFRSNDAVIVFLFAKFVMPGVAAALAAFLFFVVRIYDASQTTLIVLTVLATFLGFYAPDVYIKNLTQKRQELLQKGLPDSLDLMVICAEAGLSLDATMNRVASEIEQAWFEMADELNLTALEIGFLPDRRQALENLANRTGLAGIRAMVNTLTQTERYGTPLADSLRVLAAELRQERLMKAEEKAARLPATLTVPMIVFILPPLFIVLIGPAILRVMDMFREL